MLKYILPLLAFLYTTTSLAQKNTFKATIKDSSCNTLIQGATITIKTLNLTTISNENGEFILKNIPNGEHKINISNIGFQPIEVTLNFPLADNLQSQFIYIEEMEEEEEEVIVKSTRTSRTIANTPTRVETIDFEEIDEKANMKPANVSMILHESTGIQVQQTSATSANASIRIQGLDGRYTQLLKDGFASFGNFASGLSILEIPPLDLKQVEIIKGAASTLYGAGAIAGVVNFVSKTPKEKAEYSFIINQSNIGQTNIGGFAMHRNKKIGYSILASTNFQKAYDVDKDNFSELPKTADFTIHPKLFFYPNENTSITIGNSYSKAERTGGDMIVINDKATTSNVYFEKNNTIRNTSTIEYVQKFNSKKQLTAKSSYSYFDRTIGLPNYTFKGSNYNSFTDISLSINKEKSTIILGGNLIFDKFKEQAATNTNLRNFNTNTIGAFAQHTWDINDKVKLESGLRTDVATHSNNLYSKTDTFILPRVSLLYKFNSQWSSRIGAGLGYKTPTLFTELTETLQYQNVDALNNVSSEKSIGATADVNFKTKLAPELNFSLNQMFFYTNINNALVLQNNLANYYFTNTNKAVISMGFETNAKFVYHDNYKFFVGYTYTNAKAEYLQGNQFLPLLPKSKLNLALIYEKENSLKIGLEGYYTSQQYLSNQTQSQPYWEFGFMVEKYIKKISIFINFENFTDTRQSRFKRVVNGSNTNPNFDEIWTHTEGFVMNGGIKIKL